MAKLNYKDRQKLAALVSELKSRGLEVPPEFLQIEELVWNISELGYFIRRDGTPFKPVSEDQKSFVDSRARFAGYFGGRGSGKTASGAQKSLYKIQRKQNGAVINPDFENFRISTWPEFREWIPWDNVVVNQQHRRNPEWTPYQPFNLVFKDGTWVICKGIKDPDSARGPNINWLWYDEARNDRTGAAFQTAAASVRVGEEPQTWVTTTGAGKSHWIHKFFIQQDIPQDAKDEFLKEGLDRNLIEAYYGTIYENRENLDPGFFASMLAMYPGGYLRQQELYGKFVDEGGNLGDRAWFINHIVSEPPETVYKRVRFWDLASTEKKMGASGKKKGDPDETVGTLGSFVRLPRSFYIEDQHSGFWEWDGVKENIRKIAEMDGAAVKVIVEEEPGSGGKNQVAEINSMLQKEIPGHPGCDGYRPEGDRVMLANLWFAEAKIGLFYMVEGAWNEGFLSQLDEFPEAKHDDKITSVSGARINLAPIRKWKNIGFMKL